jgi:CheY-like chemotaxis protein
MALVLVIEDDADAARIAADNLFVLGYEFHIVGDGIEAIRWLRHRKPDVILLDVCLPKPDGVLLYRLIRKVDNGKDVPIVPASALLSPNSRTVQDLKLLGARRFLVKPYTADALQSALEDVLS